MGAGSVKKGVEELRRGPWTVEEDLILIKYIENHGEGQWNSLARSSGLRRNGKSCRLRWLNYLRPDLRRGSITPEEQLLILELHSRFGNRWSKIAQHLPGRTDNEIKNYWRTRVQKHARQLHCDINSDEFKNIMRHLWMPRLREQIQAASGFNSQLPAGLPMQSLVSSCLDSVRFSSPSMPDSFAGDCSAATAVNGGDIDIGDQIQRPGYENCNQGLWELEQCWDMGVNWWNVDAICF